MFVPIYKKNYLKLKYASLKNNFHADTLASTEYSKKSNTLEKSSFIYSFNEANQQFANYYA